MDVVCQLVDLILIITIRSASQFGDNGVVPSSLNVFLYFNVGVDVMKPCFLGLAAAAEVFCHDILMKPNIVMLFGFYLGGIRVVSCLHFRDAYKESGLGFWV